MALFSYKAVRANGEVTEGQIEASDSHAAAQRLQAEGKTPLRINAATATIDSGARSPRQWLVSERVRARDIELFTLELATLLRAGLPLGQALETVARLAENPALARIAQELHQAIRRGSELSAALQTHPALFDRFYLNMVRAGESTGALDLALERLVEFKRGHREMRETLISALIYPAILIVLALVAVGVMLAFVVPQFTVMFAEAGKELPLLTRIVAAAGNLVANWWWLILLVVTGAGYWLRQDWRTAAGRERWDQRLLAVPLAGKLITKLDTARFTRTLATLLQNGVSLLVALDIAKEIIGNTIIAQAVERSRTRVRQGEGLARPLSETRVFPSLATQLIRLGEETGKLEHMLGQVAEIYEGEVQIGLRRLLTLAEPLIIITIAVMITVIILSVVLMILESNNLAF